MLSLCIRAARVQQSFVCFVQMDNGLKLQLVHVFADQRKDEHFFMASGAFNLQKLNCQFLKNESHLLNAPHFATSILI